MNFTKHEKEFAENGLKICDDEVILNCFINYFTNFNPKIKFIVQKTNKQKKTRLY